MFMNMLQLMISHSSRVNIQSNLQCDVIVELE